MAKTTASYYQLNRGLVSKLALARMDVKRAAMSAELMTNFVPRVLGSMMLRPGLGWIGSTYADTRAKFIPFIFSTDETALIEITDGAMRVWVDDALVSRASVTSAVTNGDFTASLAGWTASGGVTWIAAGYAQFVGNGTTDETLDQTVAVAGGDIGVEHSLRIVIARGPIKIRVGTAAGDENYVEETTLNTGTHSLAFTPSGNFTIRFFSPLLRQVWLDSCNIGAAGTLILPAPWALADLYSLRWDQSGDVIFVACAGRSGANYQQRRIERRANNSWSIVLYQSIDGPYRAENISPITITASATSGNITLTGSAPIFASTQVGGLMTVTSQGQFVTANLSALNAVTDPIEVVGVDEQRRYATTITGVFIGTVTLQYSVGVVGNWIDSTSYTAPTTQSDKDGLDNQTVFYRLKMTAYTSGTAVASLTYSIGRIRGIARITAFTSSTVVSAEVLKNLGNLVATDIWSEGSWSDRRGWPTSVAFYEGRLWWSGQNGIFGSVSDAFDDYNPDTVGASGPINRTIGSGPVDDINWLLPLQRLIIGAEGSEFSARSTAFDEPLTPANFNIKAASTQGSANVIPLKIDSRGAFVQRSGTRVYELTYSGESNDYALTDMTAIVPEVGEPSIITMAVQRQPDTRFHCIRSDGKVALAVIDRVENVLAWQLIETEGDIVDVVILPGTIEDTVYYEVDRSLTATLSGLTIVNAGAQYILPPDLEITGGGGTGATGTCTLTVNSISLDNGGAGYVIGNIVAVVGGTYTVQATYSVGTINGSGGITLLIPITGGVYTIAPPATTSLSGGSGSGTVLRVFGCGIGAVTLTNPGEGYTFAPTVNVTGGGVGGQVAAVLGASYTRLFLEKWAQESECRGAALNKQADAFTIYDGAPTSTITGLGHLENENVVAWGDGVDLSPDVDGVQTRYLVTGSSITLPVEAAQVVVGIPYTAQWKSTKLAFAMAQAQTTSGLNQRKLVTQLGLIMANVHSHGIKYGPDFDRLDPLPEVEQGAVIDYDTVWEAFDFDMMEFDGIWDTDARVCLESQAPRPCTVLAITMALEEHGKG